MNGSIYFAGKDATHGNELWKSNGTAAGTSMVADLTPGLGSSFIGVSSVVIGGRIFFNKGTTGAASELWSTDGTFTGTTWIITGGAATGSSLHFGTALTLEAWVKPSSNTSNDKIFMKASSASPTTPYKEYELTLVTSSFTANVSGHALFRPSTTHGLHVTVIRG